MRRTLLVVGAIVLVVLVIAALGGFAMLGIGRFGTMGPGMLRGYGALGLGIRPLGLIFRLASWALIIGGLVLVVTWLARSPGRSNWVPSSSPTPLDILKERYARGEISKDQYDSMKKDLA